MDEKIKIHFDAWNAEKKELHIRQEISLFHEREVWWCALGSNIGSEQDGKNDLFERPVVVFKKYNKDQLLILPITSSEKESRYRIPIKSIGTYSGVRSSVIISQMRTISSKRLLRKIGMVSIKEYLMIFFELLKSLVVNM
jgi:mRNA-degrading endonuclease toxin of MazEF toxin-antitoxin module